MFRWPKKDEQLNTLLADAIARSGVNVTAIVIMTCRQSRENSKITCEITFLAQKPIKKYTFSPSPFSARAKYFRLARLI